MASFNILLAIFLWSSLGIFIRTAGVAVHVIIFYSCFIAAVLQGTILFFRFRRSGFPGIREFRNPLILGIFALVNTFSFFYAYQNTTIANAVLTHYTAPVIVAFLAPVFLKETITRKVIAAIIIASTGLWLMLDGFSVSSGQAAGIMAGLVSGFAYAIIVILARVMRQGTDTLFMSFMINAVSVVVIAPFIREIPVNAAWTLVFMGIVHSTIAPLLYYGGFRTVTANKAAVLGYLEPVSAIIFSMIFLNETPGLNAVAGGALILFSGYLTLKGEA